MKKQLIALSLIGMTFGLSAQDDKGNLINNPDFEEVSGKVKKKGSIEAADGWFSPTMENADMFEMGNRSPEANIPENSRGTEKDSDDGKYYAGIRAYSYNGKAGNLTYLKTKFKSSLKKGAKYCVSFNVSLADLSKYSIKSVGALITKKDLSFNNYNPIMQEASILHHDGDFLNEMYGWTTICGTYEALGGEKYILLGNFEGPDAEVKKVKKPSSVKGVQLPQAYYYVDNVQVYPIESSDECSCGQPLASEQSMVYSMGLITNANMNKEQIIEYSNIYFDFSKYSFEPASVTTLNTLADLLKKETSLNIEVIGHSDANEVAKAKSTTRTDASYQDIAKKRAQKVVDYLVEQGVDASRLTVVVKDATEPAAEGDEPIDMAQNRRVVFKIK